MGTPGVPWNVSKEAIVAAIKRQHGRLTFACKELDCAYDTLRRYLIKHPDVQEIVDQCRNGFDTTLLDTAESVLMKAMTQNEMGHALKAGFFVLNNKGKDRGYNHPEVAAQKTLADLKKELSAGEVQQPD